MIGRASYVICDRCTGAGPVSCFGANDARREAETHGFIVRDGKDICGFCKNREALEGTA